MGSSGFAAKFAAPALDRKPGRFSGVLGSTAERSAALAAQYGVKAYATLDELAADPAIDAVWVTAKDSLHVPVGLACLGAGKHVLMDKPLARSVEEARLLVSAARAGRPVLRVGFHQRFRPAYRDLHAHLRAGRLGTLRHVRLQLFFGTFSEATVHGSWRSSPAETGGPWIVKEFGAHMFDLLLWLTGASAVVSGALLATQRFDVGTDDAASVLLRLDNSGIAVVEVSAAIAERTHALHLYGDKGWVRAEDIFWGDGAITWSDGEHVAYTHEDRLQPYLAELDDFADAANGRASVMATGAEGLAVQELIEAAYHMGTPRGRQEGRLGC